MKRGFKSQCERRSVEIRKSFGLRFDDPLDALNLAERNGVTVWRERDVKGLSQEDLYQLGVVDKENWLAFTMRIRAKFLIVFNSSHSAERINSVQMHELSHIMLGHQLTSAGLTEEGYLMPINFDQEQEDEANWFAGTLLLPRPALLRVRREKMSDRDAQAFFKVSPDMLTWRFRMTGVDSQLSYSRSRQSG